MKAIFKKDTFRNSGRRLPCVLSCCVIVDYNPFSERYRSASMAARHPIPAAVTAWR